MKYDTWDRQLACPTCGSLPGKACRAASGLIVRTHIARIREALKKKGEAS